MNKKIIWGIAMIVILLGIGLIWGVNKNPTTSKGNPIRIAFIGPLTGSAAVFGEIEKNTIQLAVEEINSKGGVNGRLIEVKYEDAKCEGKLAVSAAQKLINLDKIRLLIVSCSQEILPIAPITEKSKVLVFAPYANASGITNAGDYIFRNAQSNRVVSGTMAKVALEKGKRAVVLSEQSAFSTDLKNLFIEEYKKRGGTVVNNQEYPQGAKDYRSQISKMLAEKPEVVVLIPNGPATGIPALKQFRELGYKNVFVGNLFGGSIEVQSIPEAQGMIYVSDPIIAEGSAKKELFDKYKANFGEYPDLEWATGASYDAVYILKQAFEAVGDDPTKVKDYLYKMPEFTGILGAYRFDSNGDMTKSKPAVAEIKNNTSVLISQ